MNDIITQRIYRALERDEFELYYQPQVDSLSGEIVSLEALLRWIHPEKGMIGPVEFIPEAEKSDLIIDIGKWVIKTACRQNKYWQNAGLIQVPVAVNISARQLEDGGIEDTISRVFEETGLLPVYLELEITEGNAIRELNRVAEVLGRLKELGVKIAVDDFGTAYSSLHYIKQLPVDTVKIDKCFINGIGVNPKDEVIIKTIIALIRNLNLRAIAEGVETQQQVRLLADEKRRIIQGLYYYMPMPVNKIENLLSREKRVLGQWR